MPILLHGDEGVGHRRKPVLQVSWGPILGVGQPSLKRLFLVTSCPAKLYSHLNEGIEAGNPVIDKILDAVAKSLHRCFYNGIEYGQNERIFLVCIALCGDHPWQTKAMKCLRHHTRTDVCPLCLASTGPDLPFEDVSMKAMWTATVGKSPPWRDLPPLWHVPGSLEPSFIKFDLMHSMPHGVGRNFAASAICMLAGPLGHFKLANSNRRDKKTRLVAAYREFSSYCHAVGKQPRDMKEFTPQNLNWIGNNDFPDMTAKASDCTMLIQWIADYIASRPFVLTEPLDLCLRAAVAFDEFQRLCYTANRVWFGRGEAQRALEHIVTFVCCYKALTNWACKNRWTLFMSTPKLHFSAHFAYDLYVFLQNPELEYTFNPGCFATPMMEDFVGITSRIARTCHPSNVPKTVLYKYLVTARKAWASTGSSAKGKVKKGLKKGKNKCAKLRTGGWAGGVCSIIEGQDVFKCLLLSNSLGPHSTLWSMILLNLRKSQEDMIVGPR